MSDVVICVDNLGKQYRLGERERYRTIRDTLSRLALSPWKKLKSRTVEPIIEHKTFWALRDISFEIARGDVVGIIGRNGAGKSTLLKVLSQITDPTIGKVELTGRVGSLLEVGTGFHPELTGRENIFLNGAILGMKRAEIIRNFDEIVAFAEVEKFIDTPVKHYSSGMYMRLAFAVAAHLEPEILVVDEVLAVGDAQFQKKCLGKIGEVARGGRTVLFVSHDMGAVQSLCTSVLHLRSGQVIAHGPTIRVVGDYLREADHLLRGRAYNRTLGPDLELRELRFCPPALPSGGETSVSAQLYAIVDTVIEGLCVLIFSMRDTRVAVVDLRSASGPYRVTAGHAVSVTRQIRRLQLVEGDYKFGLYVRSRDTVGDFLDLGHFQVAPAALRPAVLPYTAGDRGHVELDCCEPTVSWLEPK